MVDLIKLIWWCRYWCIFL